MLGSRGKEREGAPTVVCEKLRDVGLTHGADQQDVLGQLRVFALQ